MLWHTGQSSCLRCQDLIGALFCVPLAPLLLQVSVDGQEKVRESAASTHMRVLEDAPGSDFIWPNPGHCSHLRVSQWIEDNSVSPTLEF